DGRLPRGECSAGETDLPALCPFRTDKEPEELALARTGKAGETHDLAFPDGEIDASHTHAGEVGHLEHHFGGWRSGPTLRVGTAELPADHHADDVVGRERTDGLGSNHGAVAEHGDAIAEPHDLVEAVRDVEHGAARLPDGAEHVEEQRRLRGI